MASEVNHWLILADSAVVCHLGEPIWGPAKINDNLIDALNAVTGGTSITSRPTRSRSGSGT